jgi:hypothetical protein
MITCLPSYAPERTRTAFDPFDAEAILKDAQIHEAFMGEQFEIFFRIMSA